MIGLLPVLGGRSPTVLCIGAHCDDIELGCGAALRRLRAIYPGSVMHWVVLCSTPERALEARASARLWLTGPAIDLQIHEFQDGFLPYDPVPVKQALGRLAANVSPDLIFTHWSGDRHQDHRFTSDLTWNHFRNHVVLEYEIPKFDGDLGQPSMFVPLEREAFERKAHDILESFRTQRDKEWLTVETILALARLRGVESRSPTGYAEAFHLRKALFLAHP